MISKSLPLAIILVLCFNNLSGQSTQTLTGAKSQGLGYASACLFNEWAIFNNMGGLAKQEFATASITYTLNSFLPAGNTQAIAFSMPIKSSVVAIGAYSFGDQLYKEQIITTGFANQFGLASLGLKLNYIQYQAEGLGQKGMLTVSMGGIAELTPNFSIGAHIININQPKISEIDDERLPTKLVLGIRYDPTEKVLLTTEVEKDIEYDATYKIGIGYQVNEKLTFRTGFNIQPNAAFFGIGFHHKKLIIDYAFEYLMDIGISNQATLSYQFISK